MARQSRYEIFELRQFDLELSLQALCAPGKDIQNQLAAIDHPDGRLPAGAKSQLALQIAELCDGEVVVENHDVGAESFLFVRFGPRKKIMYT